ncbi:MAG: septum site-determining protein MinC [Chloroflexota bacterium]
MSVPESALLVRRTLRAGQQIRHAGSVVILGDVNPGASVIAGSDIVVVGQLRGFAHAGATGDERATVVAFRLRPSQIRIADHIARSPDAGQSAPDLPEVASVVDGAVVIGPYRSSPIGHQLRGGSAEWGRSSS